MLLVKWPNNISLLATFAISQKYYVTFLGKLQYHQLILSKLLSHWSFGLIPFFFWLHLTFSKSPNYFWPLCISIFSQVYFSSSPNSCTISISPQLIFILDKMCGQKTTKSPIFCLYITKILWTKDKSLKCSEKNNEQTKMTRQKTEEKHNNNNLLSIYWNQ